jgi:hypothetical protein
LAAAARPESRSHPAFDRPNGRSGSPTGGFLFGSEGEFLEGLFLHIRFFGKPDDTIPDSSHELLFVKIRWLGGVQLIQAIDGARWLKHRTAANELVRGVHRTALGKWGFFPPAPV